MASKSKKKVAAKRTTNLRKAQHSHIRHAKARPMRKEVEDLLRVPRTEHAEPVPGTPVTHVSNVVVDIDVDKLVGDVVERLKAEVAVATSTDEPIPDANRKLPPPSPVEAAMIDVINVSEETEKLVHELGMRLAPVLKEGNGDVHTLGRVNGEGASIPLVDALRQRASQITAINGRLLDLLDRLAT
jgi:hypothetical protein